MKIVNKVPPVYKAIINAGLKPTPFAFYTYGDTIYNPSGQNLPDEIIEHEEVHERQQEKAGGPDAWWSRYLDDAYFRVDQEAQAYAVQYDFVCEKLKDRNMRARYLLQLAVILSSPTYGEVLSQKAAFQLIKSKVKTK